MRRRRRRPEDGRECDGLRPADVAEITARLATAEAVGSMARDATLVRRLRPLVERRVPLRQVEAVRELRASRLRFADGTALVVRGAIAGDLGVLAMWVRSTSVPVAACQHRQDGVWLVFSPPRGRRRLSVLVTGLDQPL